MTFVPGSRLGSFEILAPIGAGGMGEVYRARDTRLQRDVAIKVLPQSAADDSEARARFEREALAVASLSHPNILAIHEFGNDDGIVYAVMELLQGVTLRERLNDGPILRHQAVEYAVQIARGLSAAHEKGVVHRDLKPENVFVQKDGHVKILDFGLAKRVDRIIEEGETSTPTVSGHTLPGTVMGTVGYMSPEQVRGLPVDSRSDIFSFGAVLYELLSGHRAFQGATPADSMSAILKDEPADLAAMGGTALSRIIRRCLEKEPANRFQSASDIAFALSEASASAPGRGAAREAPAGATEGSRSRLVLAIAAILLTFITATILTRRSHPRQIFGTRDQPGTKRSVARIVVLPFDNLGTPKDSYFAAGITEEISSRLANLQGLAVISRTTANGYDRKGKTIRQIGADLGVDFVLEGAVQWERGAEGESRVRITPDLIQVSDDTHLWSDRYDRVIADVLAIQSDVAEHVVKAMGVTLAPREVAALKTAATTDMDAYDLYLRGLEVAKRGQTRQNLEEAVRLFRAASDRDPRFAQALCQLLQADLYIYFLHYDRSHDHLDRARKVVDSLDALGPDLAETHIARAYYYYWGLLDYPRALQEFTAARALQPSNSDVLSGIGFILRREGRWQEAGELMAKWLELDPRSPNTLTQCGLTDVFLHRYAEANRNFGLAASLNPQYGQPAGYRGWIQVLWNGDVEKADLILTDARRVPGLDDGLCRVAYASWRVDLIKRDFGGALERLNQETRDALSSQFYFYPIDLLRGEIQALEGKRDIADGSFRRARTVLEDRIAKEPDDPRYHSALGIAFAGLGLGDEAVRAANRGAELMPPSKDDWRAMWRIEDLALTQTMVGHQDAAIDQLDFLLSRTGEISVQVLLLDPRWLSLKSNSRYAQLLAKYRTRDRQPSAKQEIR